MKQLCDLHTHTTASDGSFTPEESVRYAKQLGACALAITDHDTILGLQEAVDEGKRIGQKVIPGIEITTAKDGCEIHIIGLYLNYQDPKLIRQVEKLEQARIRRNEQMINRLIKNGFNISHKDLERFSGSILTKAHVGQILVERGHAANVIEAMNRYLRKGGIAYVERETPSPKECIQMIHDAGGLAFVAHANQIDKNSRENSIHICRDILSLGADGLETRYCEFDNDWNMRTDALAEEYHCLSSGGSDFHGLFKKGLDMLHGYGNLEVPYEYVMRMEERLKG
ncbi:MAG: PHP domain-containing protein [Christensenellales bacterium]|jgi:predicted metal-dependent phosphoesterase TrpH